jgi:hypothetical protein
MGEPVAPSDNRKLMSTVVPDEVQSSSSQSLTARISSSPRPRVPRLAGAAFHDPVLMTRIRTWAPSLRAPHRHRRVSSGCASVTCREHLRVIVVSAVAAHNLLSDRVDDALRAVRVARE